MPLCSSVYMCLVVTCWERADLWFEICGVLLPGNATFIADVLLEQKAFYAIFLKLRGVE